MNVYSTAYFETLRRGARSSAERIVPLLLNYVPANSVIDIGCGTGTWLSVFQEQGVQVVLGVDGDYIDPAQLEIAPDCFLARDLETSFTIDRKFDLALSVEVAEHLSPDSANTFVDSLTSLAPAVAFSAAVPGQGGDKHINERWPLYWIERFHQRGYQTIDCLRRPFWDDDKVQWWYAQNLFLFVEQPWLDHRPDLRDTHSGLALPACLVHPKNLAQSVWREKTLEFCLRLADALPKTSTSILIDDAQLGNVHFGKNQKWLPFIERDGVYYGRPVDDQHAIVELERMRELGCQFVTIAWTAFWWLDHYTEFSDHLNSAATTIDKDDMFWLLAFKES